MLRSDVTSATRSTSCFVVEFRMRRSVMKRTVIAGLLVLAAGVSTFGQVTSKESLSGFHLGMTGTEVVAELKAQSADWRMVPTHPEDPNNNGFMPMGHRWSDLNAPWIGCSPMRENDTDLGLDDCTVDYKFDTLCPETEQLHTHLVMCSTVTKHMEFIFYDPNGGPPWHHDIESERVAFIGF